jgi:O-antigen/teichoic acid export membrane protein
MDQHFETRVVRNTLFIAAARVWLFGVTIFFTPYVLGHVGNTAFGIWVLVTSCVSYIGLFDVGFGPSFVKFVAEHNARGDREGVNGVISTGIAFYLVVAVLVAGAVYPSLHVVLWLLNIPPHLEATTIVLLELGTAAMLLGNFTWVYRSVIIGLQRMGISTGIAISLSVCYVAGCVASLELGLGIRGLAVVQLVTEVINLAVTAVCAHRIYPGLRVSAGLIRRHLSTLARYGGNLQVSRIAILINSQFDKLIISRFIDATHVTLYEIGSRLPTAARSLPMVLLDPLIPASAELQVRRGRAEVYGLFARASKYLAVLTFPMFCAAVATGQSLIAAWVGPGYEASVVVMRVLCAGYLLSAITGPISPMVQGLGRPDYQRNAEALSLLLNVVLSIVLVKSFGFYGAPVATSFAMAVAAGYYLWAFHRFMARPLWPFVRGTFLAPAACSAIAGLAAFTVAAVLRLYLPPGRSGALAVFLLSGSIFAVCYLALILRSRYFTAEQMTLLRAALPFSRSARPSQGNSANSG